MIDPTVRPLRLWNGRWGNQGHVYVAAHSRADAGRLLCLADGQPIPGIDREIRDYFSECWGNQMAGVTPERGVWVTKGQSSREQPLRVV